MNGEVEEGHFWQQEQYVQKQRETKECGWGLGCVAVDGNAKVKVSWATFPRALSAMPEVRTSRNSDAPEGF